MKRTDGDSHLANQFQDGDAGAGVKGTQVDASWLNNVQEELCYVIEQAGITLDGGDTTQLMAAILAHISSFNNTSFYILGYQLAQATYVAKSFSVSGQESLPHGLAFSSDGTKMYAIGLANDTVYQYTLSTAWDASTASYDSVSLSVTSQDGTPEDIIFSSDGTKMYMMGRTNTRIYQYTLSTAWDLSTASYDSISADISAQEGIPTGIAVSTDGTKMYVVGTANDTVYQYTLSTPWDISTLSYASKNKSVTAQDSAPHGVAFSADGTKMFVVGTDTDSVHQYTLTTAWDVSTANYDSISKDVSAEEGSPNAVAFSSDGLRMYALGQTAKTVFQYSTNIVYSL